MNSPMAQYLTLRVGTQWYGVPLRSVIEVHHMMLLTEPPKSTPNVIGLMSLRDNVFPILDLRLCFDMQNPEYRLDTPLVIIRHDSGYLGLVADEADTVENISDGQQVNIDTNEFAYVTGAIRLHDNVYLILDVDQFVA
jgi:purine-binding chemotaxis protein CheW